MDIPDPSSLDLAEAAGATPPGLRPEPILPPLAAAPHFDADRRLDLRLLEGRAKQMRVLGRMVLVGAVIIAVAAGMYEPWSYAVRGLASSAALFIGVLAWAGFRAARDGALASVALAQRQRELLRGLRS